MRTRSDGFTLVEVVVAATIAVFVVFVTIATARQLAAEAARTDTRVLDSATVERLSERLSAEAASAWAVYVPAVDAFGSANGDGHELAFFSEDGAHRPYAWAYHYDSATHDVTRIAYAPGNAPVTGERIGNVVSFSARATDVDALADPLFASVSAPVVHYAFSAMPGAVGGNAIVSVHVVTTSVDRTLQIASATAPTTFTVVVNYTPAPRPPPTATPAPMPSATLTPTPAPP